MVAPRRPDAEETLAEQLRTLEPPVRYDVDKGYARHQRLLAERTNLPEWADELPGRAANGLVRTWFSWLGAGTVLVGALLWFAPRSAPGPEPPPTAAVTSLAPASSEDTSSANAVMGARGVAGAPPTIDRSNAMPGVPTVEPLVPPAAEGDAAARVQEVPSIQPLVPAPNIDAPARPDGPEPVAATRSGAAHDAPVPGATRATSPSMPHSGASGMGTRSSTRPASNQIEGEAPQDREEVMQLARAEQLLASDPAAAVALVRKGNVQFKRGYLQHERRYIEVMGLFAAGRADEGKARAQFFLRDYPTSPYREKVQKVLAQAAP